MPDAIKATPRNELLGVLADALRAASNYANKPDRTLPGGKANAPLAILADLLALPQIATTAERMSYGEPLMNIGKANVPLIRPETADAAMTVLPMAYTAARAAEPGITGASNRMVQAITGNPRTTAQDVIDYATGMRGAVNPATVWHGSPHKFDKFDSRKIGTGEGAQAYGHGLYLADAKDVASSYIPTTAYNDTVRRFLDKLPEDADFEEVSALIGKNHFTPEQENVLKALNNNDWLGFDYPSQAISQAYKPDLVKHFDPSPDLVDAVSNAGYLYKVDLPDNVIARMLDWDKPLSQQAPEVQKAVEHLVAPVRRIEAGTSGAEWGELAKSRTYDPTGKEILSLMRKNNINRMTAQDFLSGGHGPEVSAAAREMGITGVRYLDQGSRGAGAGTSNYVVFPGEESILKILSRNGQELP